MQLIDLMTQTTTDESMEKKRSRVKHMTTEVNTSSLCWSCDSWSQNLPLSLHVLHHKKNVIVN